MLAKSGQNDKSPYNLFELSKTERMFCAKLDKIHARKLTWQTMVCVEQLSLSFLVELSSWTKKQLCAMLHFLDFFVFPRKTIYYLHRLLALWCPCIEKHSGLQNYRSCQPTPVSTPRLRALVCKTANLQRIWGQIYFFRKTSSFLPKVFASSGSSEQPEWAAFSFPMLLNMLCLTGNIEKWPQECFVFLVVITFENGGRPSW